MIPCRMKSVRGWGDACIHNISSRGMMIACDDPLVPGDYVDIRRGRQVVIGLVIWRRDCYTGIRTQDVISADTLINEPRLEGRPVQSAAEAARRTSRSRAVSRIDTAHGLDRSRWLAGNLQFGALCAFGLVAAIVIALQVAQMLAIPTGRITQALAVKPDTRP